MGTILGAEEPCDTVGSGACGGGGGNQTYETQCGTCPGNTCAYTCGNTWCTMCVTEGTCPSQDPTNCMGYSCGWSLCPNGCWSLDDTCMYC